MPEHRNNGEEADYAPIANFSKGLPHNEFGEADPKAYRLLRRAVATGQEEDYERIPLGGERKLTNPRAGLSFDLDGAAPQALPVPPAPRIDRPRNSGEMAELYWMALCGDRAVHPFDADPVAAEAADDLSTGYSDLRVPRQRGTVTPATLLIPQRQDTPEKREQPDFLTDVTEWLKVQDGDDRTPTRNLKECRYIQTPRDMTHYRRS